MDLNLFLLKPEEIALLQDISLFQTTMDGAKFSFEETRNNVDVIIVNNDDQQIFIDNLEEEEEEIRRIIGEEKKRRIKEEEERKIEEQTRRQIEKEGSKLGEEEIRERIDSEIERRKEDRNGQGQMQTGQEQEINDDSSINDRISWPCLPIYEGGDNVDPFDWTTELSLDDMPSRSDLPVDVSEKDQWLREFKSQILKECKEEIDDQRLLSFLSREEYTYGLLTNSQLLQLDLRLRQLKCYHLRLFKTNPKYVSWSGSLLGCYLVKRTKKRPISSKRVYLFIDNIVKYSTSQPYRTRESVIAEVFTHEMFHAYYDNVKTKDFIAHNLTGVREIEEIMAEYGMLRFLKEYDSTYSKKYFDVACSDVKNKLSSVKPYLHCYGLGVSLYDEWEGGRFPKIPKTKSGRKYISFFELYQKIQPSPRKGAIMVDTYCRETYSTMTPRNEWLCIKDLYKILWTYHFLIKDSGQHYLFDGKSIGHSNRLVCEVLQHYVNYNSHAGRGTDLPTIEADFDNRNAKNYGKYYIFEEENIIQRNKLHIKYQTDRPINLDGGKIICPCRIWTNDMSGNMLPFLKKVYTMYKNKKIDERIVILR